MNNLKHCLAIGLLVVPAFAHDLYLMPERFIVEPGSVLEVGFHNGDAFPESEASPVLERVREPKVTSAAGSTDITNLHVVGNAAQGNVKIDRQGGFILSVRTVPNLLALPAEEFEAYLKEEGLDQIIQARKERGESKAPSRERYSKYAKALVSAGGDNTFHAQALGMPIEIVPERSPVGLKPGDSLPVRVLFQGKPAPALQVEATWAASGAAKTAIAGRTDADGRMNVPLPSAGKWRLHTILIERCHEPAAADWESYWASLTFEIR